MSMTIRPVNLGRKSGQGCLARRAKRSCIALALGTALAAFALPALAGQTAPPPKAGLGSNHNYYLYNDGRPILGLVVELKFTKDVVCDDLGFHVQLNANSPNESNIHTNWQQYVMGFRPKVPGGLPEPHVGCSIEYFAKPYSFNTHNHRANLVGLPGPRTLPAGARFIIRMEYDGNNVSGAKFTYVEREGKNHHDWTLAVPPPGLMPTGGGPPPNPHEAQRVATEWVRTPIVAFQVDIVGMSGGDHANMKSGAGTITYTASEPMSVVNKKPDSKGSNTAETANSVYGLLPTGWNKTFVQTFAVGSTPLPPLSFSGVQGNPIVSNPVSGNTGVGLPVHGNPIAGAPITGAPVIGTPIHGNPVIGGPVISAPGEHHPHYLHALSDLRHARAWLTALGEKNVMGLEMEAVVHIDKAIDEIKRAAIDDGKNLSNHPPVDINLKHKARLAKALDLLEAARNDMKQDHADPKAHPWREKAVKHDDDAIEATRRAIKDAS
jgi:hypothetical protein